MDKSILDEFERVTINVWEGDKVKATPVWKYGELFTCAIDTSDNKKWWQIGCAPIGAFFPYRRLGAFPTIEDACQAIKDLVKANNAWALVTNLEKWGDLLEEVRVKNNGNNQGKADYGVRDPAIPNHANPVQINGDSAAYN